VSLLRKSSSLRRSASVRRSRASSISPRTLPICLQLESRIPSTGETASTTRWQSLTAGFQMLRRAWAFPLVRSIVTLRSLLSMTLSALRWVVRPRTKFGHSGCDKFCQAKTMAQREGLEKARWYLEISFFSEKKERS